MLVAECGLGGVQWRQPCEVRALTREDGHFHLATSDGTLVAPQLVVATGGLSIPKIGATDFGLQVARQFGLPVVPRARPWFP